MIPMINDGYKPTFEGNALSAYFNGLNAANADNSAQEEILRQYLANQRELQMAPLDIESKTLDNRGKLFDNFGKELNARRNKLLNTPELLQQFVQNTTSDWTQNINKGAVDNALQPFRMKAVPDQGNKMVADANIDNQIVQLETRIAQEKDPIKRMGLQQERNQLVEVRGYTPKHAADMNKVNAEGGCRYDTAIDAASIGADATRDAAASGGKAAWAQLAPVLQREVSNIESKLTQLNQNALGDEIAERIKTRNLKPGTEAYKQAAETEKVRWRAQLMQELANTRAMYRQVINASGLVGGAQPMPQEQPNIIKLD